MTLFFIGLGALKVLIIASIIVAIIKIVKYIARKKDYAVNLLKERYARGEIDEKEYRERLAILSS